MKLAADLSLYPLNQDYIPPILDIIARFESYPDVEIRRNDLSTQLWGDYDRVMEIVTLETRRTFEEHKAVLVAKFVCVDA